MAPQKPKHRKVRSNQPQEMGGGGWGRRREPPRGEQREMGDGHEGPPSPTQETDALTGTDQEATCPINLRTDTDPRRGLSWACPPTEGAPTCPPHRALQGPKPWNRCTCPPAASSDAVKVGSPGLPSQAGPPMSPRTACNPSGKLKPEGRPEAVGLAWLASLKRSDGVARLFLHIARVLPW